MAEEESSSSGGGMSRKLGPLTYWEWLVVGAGGLLVIMYFHNKNANNLATSSTTSSTDTSSQIPQFVNQTYTTVSPPSSPSTPSSNSQVAKLTSELAASRKEFATEKTAHDYWVNKAQSEAAQLSKAGSKTATTTTRPAVHKPAPRPTSAPTKTYTVVKGDNLTEIAKKEYGNGDLWRTIYDANKKIIGSNPNLIRPGQKLIIPAK